MPCAVCYICWRLKKENILTKVVVTFEVDIDVYNLGVEYGDEDYLTEAIKEHVVYAMDRLDSEVLFHKIDIGN